MRDYGKVFSSFWTSSNIRALSEDGRALAIYVLTSPHGTISGAFRLPDGYESEDLQWSSERVKKGFEELLRFPRFFVCQRVGIMLPVFPDPGL